MIYPLSARAAHRSHYLAHMLERIRFTHIAVGSQMKAICSRALVDFFEK